MKKYIIVGEEEDNGGGCGCLLLLLLLPFAPIIFAIFRKLSGKGGCLSFVIAIIVTPFWFAAVAALFKHFFDVDLLEFYGLFVEWIKENGPNFG